MPLIDPRQIDFLLDDVLGLDQILALPAFRAHDRAGVAQVLATAERLAVEAFLPSYARLDANEPVMENGRAVLPNEIAEALDAYRNAGFFGMTAEPEHGGLGLPRLAANAAFLWFQAANVSIANYALLTMSAAELLARHASAEQKARYMAPMIEGRFLGTMALSEPHAGSSLGDLTTTARPRPDGTYALRGTKMWISGGEHDMAENIVHLMLARIAGAPAGVKGISLFIVPRRRLDAANRPAQWNNIALAGLNHKMGQRGTVNTILNVGESGETIGEIVGAPGEGLAAMFTMMNEARIGVSMGAVAHASAGFLHSLAYARERRQGRRPDAKDPASPQVPLTEHADVRRMLLQQKAAAEGGMALGLHLARLADLKAAAEDAPARTDAALLLDLLTPVFKAWISEECLTANSHAMQVLGGAGYTRDHPLEQHYRDNRLNPIHEGTNGIQAIDLTARKLALADGRALRLLLADMRAGLAAATGTGAFDPDELAGLGRLFDTLEEAAQQLSALRAQKGAREALARAGDMMDLMGTAVFAWIWVLQATAAARARASGRPVDRDFLAGKIATAGYVLQQALPRGRAAFARMRTARPAALHMRDEWFG
jgi:butyryl-CoA dehydrogenase